MARALLLPSRVVILLVASVLAWPLDAEAQRVSLRASFAIESAWYLQRLAFWGLHVEGEIFPAKGPVALVIEGAWSREWDGDDELLWIGSFVAAHLPIEGWGGFRLGVGLNWLRWQDPYGWDQGVWERLYSKFNFAFELPFSLSKPLRSEFIVFLEASFLPPQFSVVSAGVRVPL